MTGLARMFAAMAYNDAWANHRLAKSVAELTHEELVATRTSYFPSLRATLNHLVTVAWLYVDALERAYDGREAHPRPGDFFEPEEPFDTFAPLRAAQRSVDERLVRLCIARSDADLDTDVPILRKEGIVHDSAARVLAHLFQHQIHHRGQVHAMLAGTRVAPPQLDEFFCSNEAHLRAAELAELGYSETMIWD